MERSGEEVVKEGKDGEKWRGSGKGRLGWREVERKW